MYTYSLTELTNQKSIQTLTKIKVSEFKHLRQTKKGFLVMNRHKLKAFLTIAFASNWTNVRWQFDSIRQMAEAAGERLL